MSGGGNSGKSAGRSANQMQYDQSMTNWQGMAPQQQQQITQQNLAQKQQGLLGGGMLGGAQGFGQPAYQGGSATFDESGRTSLPQSQDPFAMPGLLNGGQIGFSPGKLGYGGSSQPFGAPFGAAPSAPGTTMWGQQAGGFSPMQQAGILRGEMGGKKSQDLSTREVSHPAFQTMFNQLEAQAQGQRAAMPYETISGTNTAANPQAQLQQQLQQQYGPNTAQAVQGLQQQALDMGTQYRPMAQPQPLSQLRRTRQR